MIWGHAISEAEGSTLYNEDIWFQGHLWAFLHDYINILRKIECIKLLKIAIIYFFSIIHFLYPTKFPPWLCVTFVIRIWFRERKTDGSGRWTRPHPLNPSTSWLSQPSCIPFLNQTPTPPEQQAGVREPLFSMRLHFQAPRAERSA